jgi:hypothetical protein
LIQDQEELRNLESKNLFAGIPSFQIPIPQFLCGDFFNSIGQTRSFGEVGSMSGLPESGQITDVSVGPIRATTGREPMQQLCRS